MTREVLSDVLSVPYHRAIEKQHLSPDSSVEAYPFHSESDSADMSLSLYYAHRTACLCTLRITALERRVSHQHIRRQRLERGEGSTSRSSVASASLSPPVEVFVFYCAYSSDRRPLSDHVGSKESSRLSGGSLRMRLLRGRAPLLRAMADTLRRTRERRVRTTCRWPQSRLSSSRKTLVRMISCHQRLRFLSTPTPQTTSNRRRIVRHSRPGLMHCLPFPSFLSFLPSVSTHPRVCNHALF